MSKKVSAPKVDRDWQAEDDLRTLTRAFDIQGDGKRMGEARRMHQKQLTAMTKTGRKLKGGR